MLIITWQGGTKEDTFNAPHLFDQVPSEAVIRGELQANLCVNVRGGLAAAAHDQWELQTVRGSDLHRLSFHITDAGARAGLTRETAGKQGGYHVSDAVERDRKASICRPFMWHEHLSNFSVTEELLFVKNPDDNWGGFLHTTPRHF